MNFKKVRPEVYGKLLFEMDKKAFCKSFDYPSDSVSHTLEYLSGCEVYLAEEKNIHIGTFSYKISKDQSVEFMQLAVLPEYQGKGYGQQLLHKFLTLVTGKTVKLATHPKNTRAIILYLKNGFEIVGWKDNYYGDGQPRLLFKL